jgi:hypothetical protein
MIDLTLDYFSSLIRRRRQSGSLPFGITILKAPDFESALSKHRDRLECQHAVGAATIGDDVAALRDLPEAARQLSQRNVNGLRHVASFIFVLRADIEYGHKIVLEAANEFLVAHRFKGIALMEVPRDHLSDFGNAGFDNTAQRTRQIEDPERRYRSNVQQPLLQSAH